MRFPEGNDAPSRDCDFPIGNSPFARPKLAYAASDDGQYHPPAGVSIASAVRKKTYKQANATSFDADGRD